MFDWVDVLSTDLFQFLYWLDWGCLVVDVSLSIQIVNYSVPGSSNESMVLHVGVAALSCFLSCNRVCGDW
jgi:hypothetical protein